MANEKKGEQSANPVVIPMQPPQKRRRSHETQMLKPLELIDPGSLLDGQASPQARELADLLDIDAGDAVKAIGAINSIHALLPAATSQEIDLLFANALPMDEGSTGDAPEHRANTALPEAPLEDLSSTPAPLFTGAEAALQAAQAETQRDHVPLQRAAHAPALLDGTQLPELHPPPPPEAITPQQSAIGDAIFDVLSQQQAAHEQSAAPTEKQASVGYEAKAARAAAAETYEDIGPGADTAKGRSPTAALVAVASANTERNSAVQEALIAAQAPTDVAKTQASSSLAVPKPDNNPNFALIEASLDAAQTPTEIVPKAEDPTQTRHSGPIVPARDLGPASQSGSPGPHTLDTVATLVEGALDLAPDLSSLRAPRKQPPAAPRQAAKEVRDTQPSRSVQELSSALKPSPALRLTHLPFVTFHNDKPTLKVTPEPRYEELKLLGTSTTTENYLVKDNDLQRLAVLKRLKPEHHTDTALPRFIEHIQHVGQLTHPAITPIHDVGVDAKGRYYYVEKYVGGETLDAIIEKLGRGEAAYQQRFGLTIRLEIITRLLHAVRFAHAQGIVHRDLTPSCVVVGPYGDVTLQGWGLAQQQRNRPSHAKVEPLPANLPMPTTIEAASPFKRLIRHELANTLITGTPAYMAPERFKDAVGDERSDIYSLSAIAYELLTLRHYLNAERTHFGSLLTAVAKKEPAKPDQVGGLPGDHPLPIPPAITQVLLRGLAKDPAQRPARIQELYLAVQRRPAPPRRRSPLTFGLLGLCFAFAGYGLLQIVLQLWGMWMLQP